MGDHADLADRARAWLAEDPDPVTRAELAAVLAMPDPSVALAARFGARLEFGTAGLRGPLGAGPNRMNRAIVRRAAAGIAAWLGAGTGGVVIGFDARHRSADFAADSAAVLAGAGIDAFLLPGPLPTPVLAFAVRHLECGAGIMVTASHNPPADNGYKVYDGSGAQIVPPADGQISAAIDAVGPLASVPLGPPDDACIHWLGDEVVEAYLAGALSTSAGPAGPLRIVYTPLHGVGGGLAAELLTRAGFDAPVVVPEQADPDPDFPTVAFPNPEEPGAIDLALALARKVDADVVLANDPDADRLAVALPDPEASDAGGWTLLSGDEVGALLADALLSGGGLGPDDVVATTIVSSSLLGRMATTAGVGYAETLTGFKWIARAAGPGRRLRFGYEEALGYCVGDLVADKDGLTALLAFARRLVALRAEGSSPRQRLDELAVIHGLHLTRQVSIRTPEAAAAMAALRDSPPAELAGRVVARVDDLLADPSPVGLPSSDVVVLRLDGARVVVRPSGTEPKLKAYVEVVVPAGERAEGRAILDAIAGGLRPLLRAQSP